MGFAKYAEDNYEIFADRCYMRGLSTEPVVITTTFTSSQIRKTGAAAIWDALKKDYERKD